MKSLLDLQELLSAVKGSLIGEKSEITFTTVQTDSRAVVENTMFVPLIGEFQDGHKYVAQSVEKGASVVLVDRKVYESGAFNLKELAESKKNVAFVLVENTLHALQDAAEAYVNNVCQNMIKVCITGSSGKTTTKELMVSVAKAHFGDENVAYTKGNFNSETGLPLSVFCIKGDEKIGIFEMGMNRENEIGEISKVFKAKYGIITNIGTAHIGILGSRENIAKEKRKAFDYIPADGAAFVPATDDFAEYCTAAVHGKVVKYGKSIDSAVSGVKFISDDGLFGTTFELDGVEIHLPLTGSYNYSNTLGVVACAKELEIPANDIKKGIENLKSISGRMDISKAVIANNKNVVLLKDFYNANPDSMGKAVEFCGSLSDYPSKIFVLADMKELGKSSKDAHKNVGLQLAEVAEKSEINVILIGKDIKPAVKVLKRNNNVKTLLWIKNNGDKEFETVCEKINEIAVENSVVLFKGSHSMKLDQLCKMLQGEVNG